MVFSFSPKNSTPALTPAIQPRMPWRVTAVRALPSFKLHICFVDGTEGTVDLSAKIHAANAGVFGALAEPALFNQVFVEYGAVTWPGEVDLAPDALYAQVKQSQNA